MAQFESQLSDLSHQLAHLQCRVSSLERLRPDADIQPVGWLPSRHEAKPSARVVQKLEEVTFYRPSEVLEVCTIPGLDNPSEPDATAQRLGAQWNEFCPLGEGPVGTALPDSILNYCLARLTLSKRPWRDPALGYLLVLVTSQQLLMGTFLMSSDIMADAHATGPQQMSLIDCALADAWTFGGQSITKIVAACISMFLIGSLLKTNDAEHLELVYYAKHELGWGLWSFLMWVWYIQGVYLPAMFCIEASILFAASADATCTEIIMNGLAVVYIMEVDNNLYWSLLDCDERVAYQRELPNLDRTCTTQRYVAWYARFLFAVSMVFMFFNYAFSLNGLSLLKHMSNGSLIEDAFIFSWLILHGIRSVAHFSMLQTSTNNEWTPSCCQRFWYVCKACLICVLSTVTSNYWAQLVTGILTGNVTYDYLLLHKVPECIEHAQQGTSH